MNAWCPTAYERSIVVVVGPSDAGAESSRAGLAMRRMSDAPSRTSWAEVERAKFAKTSEIEFWKLRKFASRNSVIFVCVVLAVRLPFIACSGVFASLSWLGLGERVVLRSTLKGGLVRAYTQESAEWSGLSPLAEAGRPARTRRSFRPSSSCTRFVRLVSREGLLQAITMVKRLYVGNLGFSVSSGDLRELFESFGGGCGGPGRGRSGDWQESGLWVCRDGSRGRRGRGDPGAGRPRPPGTPAQYQRGEASRANGGPRPGGSRGGGFRSGGQGSGRPY